jgi:hydrogenase-4 component E
LLTGEVRLPVAVTVVLMGLVMVVSRRLAFTQVLGILVMENGVFLAGLALTYGLGLLLELGIAANLLLLAIIARLFIYRIKDTFDTVDSDALRSLEG